MDATQVIKSNLTPAKIVGVGLGMLAILAIADAAGLTNWIIYPVSSAKSKLSKQ